MAVRQPTWGWQQLTKSVLLPPVLPAVLSFPMFLSMDHSRGWSALAALDVLLFQANYRLLSIRRRGSLPEPFQWEPPVR